MAKMAQVFLDLFYSLSNCLTCFSGSPTLKINSRSFKILRLLGEGGFSYVYLVQDTSTSELLALKKIRCPFGAESVAQAMREVEAYKLFEHSDGIIHSVDYSISGERGGDPGSKTVYVLLPYYRRGNLQDMINANLVNHTRFPEKKLMLLFLGVCRALRDMHVYRGAGPGGAAEAGASGGERMEVAAAGGGGGGGKKKKKKGGAAAAAAAASSKGARAKETGADEDDETAQQLPLMVGDEDREGRNRGGGGRGPGGSSRSYAHRDIKPGNIMISDNGADPILMDLGSIAESPLAITSRSIAIATQDTAAEHSTMPYRAPELFDVKTGTVVDTKVDVWSLGCTLYACLVGKSPFEARSDETGGSLSICVLGGDWRFPDEAPGGKKKAKGKDPAGGAGAAGGGSSGGADPSISEPIRDVVRRCLKVEPSERPDIDELIDLVEAVIEEIPEDDGS
ncbi:NAK protein kinase [Gaeumannomyces tritici R3-111a-1]|uniref:non-specific serine/threonine protein kinase n=1 Tax=Gaeumannomyces tritici (strain R3-111a-1) TaxID=644352 RepID=J3NQY0_GAET3|nr:NAK protein kinase [Gaeumannomyces tritici R3-111a-1]EJT78586.1 NAK protein kinase [Gaeumannomyces tritici R3-111a-1]